MRLTKFLLLTLCILSFSFISSLAQDDGFVNDPTVNDDANACLAGGSMEGKCNADSDGDGIASTEEIEWAWMCGWYLIRWEYGMIPTASFPDDCSSLFQYMPTQFCILDFILFSGTPNVFGNVVFYSEPICGGNAFKPSGKILIIAADNINKAMDVCTSLVGPGNSGFFIYKYPGPEENLWVCFK